MIKRLVFGSLCFLSLPLFGQVDTSLYQSLQIKEVTIREDAAGLSIDSKSAQLDLNISRTELKKAACCNLSESFETNPSIDVAFTDAVTGTKQIQLFGLAGKYAQIQVEMTPLVRGLLANSGLQFIPGTWVQGIQLTKGIGAVSHGPESMTGQINVELLKPEDLVDAAAAPDSEGRGDVLLNGYFNQGGRFEINEAYGVRLNKKWMISSLGHFSGRQRGTDVNGDGFLDNPLGYQVNGMLRARYFGQNGWEGLYTFHALEDVKQGGQMANAFAPGIGADQLWTSQIKQGRLAFTAKTGWVNPDLPDQSFGSIVQVYSHELGVQMGLPKGTAPSSLYSQLRGIQNGGMAQVLYYHGWGALVQTSALILQHDAYQVGLDRLELGNGRPWVENNVGLSTEWTYQTEERFTAVLGMRVDAHSIAGNQFSPRFHMRWEPWTSHTFRVVAGRGFRMAQPLLEEYGRLASQRFIRWEQYGQVLGGDLLSMESATNLGLSYSHPFMLNYMAGGIQADLHRTQFQRAVIHDFYTPGERSIYPVTIRDWPGSIPLQSISAGISINYNLNKRSELRMAYRYQDLKASYYSDDVNGNGLMTLPVPFVAPHRLMVHYSRSFKGGVVMDVTLQRYGKQAIPGIDPSIRPAIDYAPAFHLLSAQIRHEFKGGDLYIGMENALNVTQSNPIDGAVSPQTSQPLLPSDPYFQSHFDATRIWGPIFGRMLYLGTNIAL